MPGDRQALTSSLGLPDGLTFSSSLMSKEKKYKCQKSQSMQIALVLPAAAFELVAFVYKRNTLAFCSIVAA